MCHNQNRRYKDRQRAGGFFGTRDRRPWRPADLAENRIGFGPLCEYRIRARGSAPVALFGGAHQKHKAQERSVRDWLKVESMLCLRSMDLTVLSPRTKFLIDARR